MKIRRNIWIYTNLVYSGSTIKICMAVRSVQVCISMFCKIIQGFSEPFMGNRLLVLLCLSALNVRVAGAAHDRSLGADVEIWPEAKNVKSAT